jgi:hypothetical protein
VGRKGTYIFNAVNVVITSILWQDIPSYTKTRLKGLSQREKKRNRGKQRGKKGGKKEVEEGIKGRKEEGR